MTDKEYIEYAKTVHEDIYAMSTPTVNSMADHVLTRIRKRYKNLFPLKEEWTRRQSNNVDVVDVMTVLAVKGFNLADMHPELESILDENIIDRYNEIDPKAHFFVKYRYIIDFELISEVKKIIYSKLKDRYNNIVMQSRLEFYPDLKDVQPVH